MTIYRTAAEPPPDATEPPVCDGVDLRRLAVRRRWTDPGPCVVDVVGDLPERAAENAMAVVILGTCYAKTYWVHLGSWVRMPGAVAEPLLREAGIELPRWMP